MKSLWTLKDAGSSMADKWDTPRRCERCLLHDEVNLCKAQYWGKSKENHEEYLLTCEKCGWSRVTEWDGH